MYGEVTVASQDVEVPDSYHAAVRLCCTGSAREVAIARLRAGWRAPGRLVLLTGVDNGYADAIIASPSPAAGRAQNQGRIAPAAPTLRETVDAVLISLGTGAFRRDGEREVPLEVWRTSTFQRWYSVQRAAGNRLVGARPVWSFHTSAGVLFFWALHVTVHVAAEDRLKQNEVVLSRPDTAHVLLYRTGASLGETILVLVREYRSPGTAADGFVHELPGGSDRTNGGDGEGRLGEGRRPRALAAKEVWEETGFHLDPARLREHGTRPVAATLSAHHAHVYSAELTKDELEWFRRQDRPQGVAGDSELTWLEIRSLEEVLSERLVDWSTLGMIYQVMLEA